MWKLYLEFMHNLVRQIITFLLSIFFGGLVYLRAIIFCIDFFELVPFETGQYSISMLQEQNSILFNPILIPLFCHGLATFVAFIMAFLLLGNKRNNWTILMIGVVLGLAIVFHDIQMNVSGIWLVLDLLTSSLLFWGVFLFFLKWN